MMTKPVFALLMVLAACASGAERYERADLLRMMRSADGMERALARQLLPRESVERVGEIVAALGDPSEPVWRTASNILSDIANEVSAPGREPERKFVAEALLARLSQRPGRDEAARILNIVHLGLPEGANVGAIAAYLDDPSLRMNARDALQLAGTSEASAALRDALARAEGTFALALIDSLGGLRDPAACPALEDRLDDHDPRVRAAAARALAWTGDARRVEAYRRLLSKAPSETYAESGDAYLLLADAVMAKGGQFDAAMDMYAWAARECKGPALRGAAIASMGRYGDGRVVSVILDAARRAKKGTLDHAALDALAVLQGHTGSQAIFERHAELLDRFGPSVYAVYGRRGDEMFLPHLLDALSSRDAYTRRVAMLALLDSNRAAGIEAVAKQAGDLEGEARDLLVDRLAMKAIECRENGNAAGAGAAYAGLYRLASTEKDRQFALAGMMQFPTEEAFALVKDMIGEDQLAELSVPFLAGIARALYAANRPEDAGRVIDAITPRIATPADLQAFLGAVSGGGPDLARKLGFVTQWHVIGPFPWSAADGFSQNHIGAPAVDVAASITAADGKARTWRPAQGGGPSAIVDLAGLFGMVTNSVAYAFAEIDVPASSDAALRMGSDDGIKVWVNGEVVHEHNVDRGLAADQDQANAKLVAGKNKILVEITQGGGGWNFCLCVVGTDGRPLTFK